MPGQRVSFYGRRVVAATGALGVVAATGALGVVAAAGAPADRVTLVVLAVITVGLVVGADLTSAVTARAGRLLVTGDWAGAFVVATLEGATGLAGALGVVAASAAARVLRVAFGFVVVVL